MSAPRVVLSGPDWRVVALELADQHGVLRLEYVIELTEPKAKDRLGVQKWTELNDKSAWSDWMRVARRFLDELLKAAGEVPDAKLQNGLRVVSEDGRPARAPGAGQH